jgi:4-amino-4-deoxy-L-arabinose transferase-like glycosyltransferase
MNMRDGSLPGLLLLWLVVLLLSLLTRPLLPVDETRYVAVAWEMWQRGDFLVPYLNGAPYSHKPPLFFWLIHAGWWLFGVNEWWPRCVGALVSLAVLFASARLARALWPEDATTACLVPWVLFAGLFWMAFYTWVQIDQLLVLCCVGVMIGMVLAAQGRAAGGWLLAGLGIGLGVLAKGPVVLLQVLPVALLGPFWHRQDSPRAWVSWYAGIGASVVVGGLIALSWALPATRAGGEEYRQAILWGQTAHRVVDAFAHAHPWWWYLPWLPLLLAPWVFLPWLWKKFAVALRTQDAGLRFCLIWLLSALVLMSLVSGKQVKYLLPLLPAFALCVARVLSLAGERAQAPRAWTLAITLLLAGCSFFAIPLLTASPSWTKNVSPLWGILVMAGAVPVLLAGRVRLFRYPQLAALWSAWILAGVAGGVFRSAAPAYDLQQASQVIAAAREAGRPVVNLSAYHGQFGFYGRLAEPLETLPSGQAPAWAGEHPQGYLIAYYRDPPAWHPGMVFMQPYRGGGLAIWEGAAIAARPGLLP